MAKTIKSLLKISMAIRNLGTLNRCTVAKRFIQTTSSCGTRYNKDELISAQPHLLNQDITGQSLSFTHCNNHEAVFRLVRNNQQTMKGSDAARALNALFIIDKKNGQKTSRIIEQQDFLRLCDILKKNIRQLDVSTSVSVIKALRHFDVPSTSIIAQSVFQMIRHSVNDLTIQEIEFLDFLLKRCDRTPITSALNIAMPIVYERNVIMQLNRDNMKSIVSVLRYLCKYSVNVKIFDVIIHAIRKCKQPIDDSQANSIMWSLFNIQCTPHGLPSLLNDVQTIIARNITNLDRKTILILLKHLSRKVNYGKNYYYNEALIDACASTVISEDWGLCDAIQVLHKLVIIGHTQIFLLDYIAAKCFENPSILESCTPLEITMLIEGFSHADYKPVFWDVIQECVVRLLEGEEYDKFSMTRLVVNLITLDCYRPKSVEKVFAKYATEVATSQREKSKILLLYQAIKTLYPQYTGPWPMEENLDDQSPTMPGSHDFPLLTTLESAVGGRRYVLTNVRSSLGHIIDHVLVMRKGGFPVAINNQADPTADIHPIRQLDELQPPPDSQVILLRLISTRGYSINSQRMKGASSLRIRTLETLSGHTVIPIQSSMWLSLEENEKMPYLMQAIRLKCDDISMSANP